MSGYTKARKEGKEEKKNFADFKFNSMSTFFFSV